MSQACHVEGLFPHVSEAHWVYFFSRICYHDMATENQIFKFGLHMSFKLCTTQLSDTLSLFHIQWGLEIRMLKTKRHPKSEDF